MPKPNSGLFSTPPLTIITCSEKAVKVKLEQKEFWLPFSQIEDPDEDTIRNSEREEVEMLIPHWLADKVGLE